MISSTWLTRYNTTAYNYFNYYFRYWLLILMVVAFLSFVTSLLLTFSKSANVSYFDRYCVGSSRKGRSMLKDLMKRSGFGDRKLLRIVAKVIGGVDRKSFQEVVEDLWNNTTDKDCIGQGGIIGNDQNRYTQHTLCPRLRPGNPVHQISYTGQSSSSNLLHREIQIM